MPPHHVELTADTEPARELCAVQDKCDRPPRVSPQGRLPRKMVCGGRNAAPRARRERPGAAGPPLPSSLCLERLHVAAPIKRRWGTHKGAPSQAPQEDQRGQHPISGPLSWLHGQSTWNLQGVPGDQHSTLVPSTPYASSVCWELGGLSGLTAGGLRQCHEAGSGGRKSLSRGRS